MRLMKNMTGSIERRLADTYSARQEVYGINRHRNDYLKKQNYKRADFWAEHAKQHWKNEM